MKYNKDENTSSVPEDKRIKFMHISLFRMSFGVYVL